MKRLAQHMFAGIIIFGAITWGRMGLFGANVITTLFGEGSLASRALYILIGIAGLFFAVLEANEHSR